jgi:transcriptional regulator with XRE-family HTH domain
MTPADKQVLGDRLRAARERAGLTKREMARRMIPHVTEQCPSLDSLISYIKRWEPGKHDITAPYRFALARALDMDEAELFGLGCVPQPSPRALESSPGSLDELGIIGDWDDMERRRLLLAAALGISTGVLSPARPVHQLLDPDVADRLAQAHRRPQRVDVTTVQALADVLAAQRRAEDALGSAAILAPALAQLTVVEDLVKQAHGPVRSGLVHVAQQWAQFTAYLHRDTGDTTAERARLAQALEFAAEINDRTMTATVLVNRARIALLTGEVGSAIGLAQAAQRDPRVAAGQRAYGADLEACGHAMSGDSSAAERKLSETAELAALLESRPQDRRPWSYWMSPAWFRCQRGATLGWLAHEPRYRQLAVTELESGYAGLPDDEKSSAWAALYLGHLADVHMRAGEVAEACSAALQTAKIARTTGSVRLARMLSQVHRGVAARWPNDPQVTELTEALR